MGTNKRALFWPLLLLLLTSSGSGSTPGRLPRGWHIPSATQASQDFRRRDRDRYLAAVGDFNGDGTQDRAVLLVNDASSKLALFVCLRMAGACGWQLVEQMDIALVEVMGIAAVKKGRYKTACGKGYWDCEEGEPEILVLRHEAIELFRHESANSYYVYDGRTKKFTPVAISD